MCEPRWVTDEDYAIGKYVDQNDVIAMIRVMQVGLDPEDSEDSIALAALDKVIAGLDTVPAANTRWR